MAPTDIKIFTDILTNLLPTNTTPDQDRDIPKK